MSCILSGNFIYQVRGLPGGSDRRPSAYNAGDLGSIPGLGRSPGEGNGNHSSTLAWKTPWTEEPHRLQSMGSQRLGHDWAISLSLVEKYNCHKQNILLGSIVSEAWLTALPCRLRDLIVSQWMPSHKPAFTGLCSEVTLPVLNQSMCIAVLPAQLCWTLCDPVDCSPPGSSVHGIFQARILEWAAISSSKESSPPRDWTQVSCVSCIGRQVLYH